MTIVLFKFILIQNIQFDRVLHFSYTTAIRSELFKQINFNNSSTTFKRYEKKVFNVLMVRRKSHYTIYDN